MIVVTTVAYLVIYGLCRVYLVYYILNVFAAQKGECFRSLCEAEVALPAWDGGDGCCQHSLVHHGCLKLREEVFESGVREQEEQLMDSWLYHSIPTTTPLKSSKVIYFQLLCVETE